MVGIAHSVEAGGCAVATRSGGLFMLDTAAGTLQDIGALDATIVSMHWSPDGDKLMLATGAGADLTLLVPRAASTTLACRFVRCREVTQLSTRLVRSVKGIGQARALV